MPDVLVFDNPSYVDTNNSSGSESDTVQATLTSQGYTVSAFTGLDAVSLQAALVGKQAFVIPEMEMATWNPDAETISVLQEFVSSGGKLVIHGYSGDQAGFLNAVFGFGVIETNGYGATFDKTAAAGPSFDGAPTSMYGNSGTDALTVASLPAGSVVYYEGTSGAALAEIPFGAGSVLFVGWDWYDAAPLGSTDGGWLAAYDAAISQTLPSNAAPAATNLSVSETYTEDTPLNLTDIVVSDVDSANVSVALTLSNTAAGTLTTGTSGLVTSTFSGGVWTASGPIADVNALLAGVTFQPAADFNGNFTITTSVSDGEATVTGSKAIAGLPVNDSGMARNDSFVINAYEVLNGNVLANDSDVDSVLQVGSVEGIASAVGQDMRVGSGATVRINADGNITYKPLISNTNYSDNFTYSLSDGTTAYVTVAVQAGNPSDPRIFGSNGDDKLYGTDGNDVLLGRRGADLLDGGNGVDTASYAADDGGVFVNLTLGQGFGNAAHGDTYISIENVIGTSFNDFLIGDTGVNRLEGGAGDDTIIGGLGSDILIGGEGIDTLSFEDNSGTVFVNLLTGMGYNNAAQGDTFSGFENVTGGLFDDTIIGDDGENRLDGAMGADTLVGNGGADTFVFSNAIGATNPYGSANVDTIFDFVSGEDKLEINATAFGGGLAPGSLAAGVFVMGGAAVDADDRFIYDQVNGNLYFDADGNGGGAQVLMAILPNHNMIVATDFVIV